MAMRILFVCTGNTCRSPMAEAMLRSMAEGRGFPVEVRSAGVSTVNGLPVSAHASKVLADRKVAYDGRSSAISGEAVGWADLILTMTVSHKRMLLERFPEAVNKTHTLKEFVDRDSSVLSDLEEVERLYSELHMKAALGEQLGEAERTRLLELERRIPSFDIADPFGGSLEEYHSCANEIEDALRRLLDKLQEMQGQDEGEVEGANEGKDEGGKDEGKDKGNEGKNESEVEGSEGDDKGEKGEFEGKDGNKDD